MDDIRCGKLYDAVVIGAGPAGITACLYLCRFGQSVAFVERMTPGGQMLSTFRIENYLGFPDGTEGWKLADSFAAHLEHYQLDRYFQSVNGLTRRADGAFDVRLDGDMLEAKTVIICSGASPRKLGVDGEERLTGRGVSYCAMCDGMFFKDKVVAVVGGGNAAVEESLHLAAIVRKIYLVHRRGNFRADQIHQERLKEKRDKIEVLFNHNLIGLHGDEALDGVIVVPTGGGEPRRIDVSGLFVFVGMEPVGNFLPPDLVCDEHGFVVTDCEMQTNLPGLFVAGDLRSKQCRQVLTAVGDGATAAYSAFTYLERL